MRNERHARGLNLILQDILFEECLKLQTWLTKEQPYKGVPEQKMLRTRVTCTATQCCIFGTDQTTQGSNTYLIDKRLRCRWYNMMQTSRYFLIYEKSLYNSAIRGSSGGWGMSSERSFNECSSYIRALKSASADGTGLGLGTHQCSILGVDPPGGNANIRFRIAYIT